MTQDDGARCLGDSVEAETCVSPKTRLQELLREARGQNSEPLDVTVPADSALARIFNQMEGQINLL